MAWITEGQELSPAAARNVEAARMGLRRGVMATGHRQLDWTDLHGQPLGQRLVVRDRRL
ncbi:hypothetical protein OG604_50260 [Streptomyces sp. NBC_01231]|nr:hypothetical protein OG604_50260 [Streptomyces sp. NBC_01231]